MPNAVAEPKQKEKHERGVIIPDIANEFFPNVMSGIVEVAEKEGYHIIYLGTNESIEREHSFLNLVEAQRLSGVIITPVSEKDPETRERLLRFRDKGLPVELVDRDVPGEEIDGVFSANVGGVMTGRLAHTTKEREK